MEESRGGGKRKAMTEGKEETAGSEGRRDESRDGQKQEKEREKKKRE